MILSHVYGCEYAKMRNMWGCYMKNAIWEVLNVKWLKNV